VQDFPARYAPQMGFEGANVLFDTWVQPLMMGLEEHLLTMFRGDFEFHEDAAASHLGRTSAPMQRLPQAMAEALSQPAQRATAEPALGVGTDGYVALDEHVNPVAAATDAIGTQQVVPAAATVTETVWADAALKELQKIPFFVRGKARRNTERFALEHGVTLITVDTLYDAKSHFSR
jgi:light-independent protochlorophyllide reductase subunit B